MALVLKGNLNKGEDKYNTIKSTIGGKRDGEEMYSDNVQKRKSPCPPGMHEHPGISGCHPMKQRHRKLGGSTGDPKLDAKMGVDSKGKEGKKPTGSKGGVNPWEVSPDFLKSLQESAFHQLDTFGEEPTFKNLTKVVANLLSNGANSRFLKEHPEAEGTDVEQYASEFARKLRSMTPPKLEGDVQKLRNHYDNYIHLLENLDVDDKSINQLINDMDRWRDELSSIFDEEDLKESAKGVQSLNRKVKGIMQRHADPDDIPDDEWWDGPVFGSEMDDISDEDLGAAGEKYDEISKLTKSIKLTKSRFLSLCKKGRIYKTAEGRYMLKRKG